MAKAQEQMGDGITREMLPLMSKELAAANLGNLTYYAKADKVFANVSVSNQEWNALTEALATLGFDLTKEPRDAGVEVFAMTAEGAQAVRGAAAKELTFNEAGAKRLIEAGVQGRVLDVLAKERGIEQPAPLPRHADRIMKGRGSHGAPVTESDILRDAHEGGEGQGRS